MIKRREFITLLGGASVGWAITAHAQQAAMPVIGFLSGSIQGTGLGLSIVAAYKQGLLDTGYVWGKNVMVEERWANAQYDQLPALAADLVRHQVAAIRRHGCFRELRTLVGQSGRPPRCGQPPPVS